MTEIDAWPAGHDAAPAAVSAEPRQVASVANLPLKRDFYVASGTSCGQASNATLSLVRRDGINSSRVPCDFTLIEGSARPLIA